MANLLSRLYQNVTANLPRSATTGNPIGGIYQGIKNTFSSTPKMTSWTQATPNIQGLTIDQAREKIQEQSQPDPTPTNNPSGSGYYGGYSGSGSSGYSGSSTGKFGGGYVGGQLHNDYSSYQQALQDQFTSRNNPQFTPLSYGGNVYGDLSSYKNAILSDAQTEYSRQNKNLDSAYQNGLISYDERQRLINENRQNVRTNAQKQLDDLKTNYDDTLQSQTSYFNQISPNAFQSQQDVYKGKATDVFERGQNETNTALDQSLLGLQGQERDLGSARQGFQTAYQGNKDALSGALNQQTDFANNLDLSNVQAQQNFSNSLADFRDQLNNQGLEFSKGSNLGAYTPVNFSYDPTSVYQSLNELAPQLAGSSLEQRNAIALRALEQAGVPKDQQKTYLDEFLRATQ